MLFRLDARQLSRGLRCLPCTTAMMTSPTSSRSPSSGGQVQSCSRRDSGGLRCLGHDDFPQVLKIAFDGRPGAIAQPLALREPEYRETAEYCHFGREAYDWPNNANWMLEKRRQSCGVCGLRDHWVVRLQRGCSQCSSTR